jgi:hypothetical protein
LVHAYTHIAIRYIYNAINKKPPCQQLAAKNNARERKGIGNNVSTALEKGLKKQTRKGRRGIRGSVSTVLAERLKQVHFQMHRINQVRHLH